MNSPIDSMKTSCQELLSILDGTEECHDIEPHLTKFISAVEEAMQIFNSGEIKVEMGTLPKTMHIFVTQDLPRLCQGDSPNILKACQNLRLFLVTMDQLVKPEYIGDE